MNGEIGDGTPSEQRQLSAAAGRRLCYPIRESRSGGRGNVGDLKIEVFYKGEKGFPVTSFDTKSAEAV